jgi:ATP-dependent DNA helicase RecQ
MSSSDDLRSRVRAVARRRFGHRSFLPGQEQAIAAILADHDVLLVSPTGGGKSLCYQVAGELLDGCTLVVSPLLSLQHDQIRGLEEAPDAPRAARISSEEGEAERRHALEGAASGRLDFLFLAPEQLANQETVEAFAAIRPALVAVDEAHCVSTWGHDFRPNYGRLGELLAALGSPRVLAMTATAAPPVRSDIVERLRMRDEVEVVTGFARDNIDLVVRRCSDRREQDAVVVDLVHRTDGPGIVYCRTRRSTEEYAATLTEQGVRTASYHAGMGARRRKEAHDAFLRGDVDTMVATSAFGMGIDKPDIRFVVHAQVPESVDTYYQEVGRAGRDGADASAVLVYRPEDLALGRYFSAGIPRADDVTTVLDALSDEDSPDRAALGRRTSIGPRRLGRILDLVRSVERAEGARIGDLPAPADAVVARAEAHRALQDSRVEMVRQYAETDRCRTAFVLRYFGEMTDEPCGHCDNCRLGTPPQPAASEVDLPDGVVLQGRVEHRDFGTGTVTDVQPDRVTVLFDDVGYRTLSLEVLSSTDVLNASAQGARPGGGAPG